MIEFLGALGAVAIEWDEERETYISGKAIYHPSDPEEAQEFCWHKSDSELPSMDALQLVSLLHKRKLLDIDKITVSRERCTLFTKNSIKKHFRKMNSTTC